MRFVITGKPVSQKNGKEIRRRGKGGPLFVGSNDAVIAWRDDALSQLQLQILGMGGVETIPSKARVRLEMEIYQGSRQAVDVDNACSGVMDALQKAGILKNDYSVCDLRVRRDRDRDNPRIEIELEVIP